jgi:hypothetical protein
MKEIIIWKRLALWSLVGVSLLGFQQSIFAQCPISFPSGGGSATVTFTDPWASGPEGSQTGSAYFVDQVTGNTEVPAGTYLGWCVDVPNAILSGGASSATYSALLFSSCDPTLDAQLEALGYAYPGTVYVTPQTWNQINYILNNPNGATFYTIQVAIWNLIGGPIDPTQVQTPPYPPWSQTEVSALLAAALPYANSYQPPCGGVIAVVVAANSGSTSVNDSSPIQLSIIQVPVGPTLTPGTLPCFTTVAAAEAAALTATTAQLGGTPPTGVSITSSGDCPATITVTGTACGVSFTVNYTSTILTKLPTLIGVPTTTTATYQSYSQVPAAPSVTATDACGDKLTVNYTSSQTNPNSSCDDVITRTWTATDCAGQTTTFTQTITVNNTSTQTICGSCGFQNCNGGYVWCNAHLTCNPGQACTVYCQNASVTLTCKNGHTYTYPVPDCQVNFSRSCGTANCSFRGGNWSTTVPCQGDSQIFLSGCGIPWQSDFANCSEICWTGTFCCSTPGVNCQWQCGASCYSCNLGNCGSIQVKPCYQNYCGYNNSDCAGTPENYKQYCQGGYNQGGNNYCGSWSNGGSFGWH